MMYYKLTHLPESGGQLLITSLTHNKKTTSSSIDILLLSELTEYFSLIDLMLSIILLLIYKLDTYMTNMECTTTNYYSILLLSLLVQ